jgi:hypothetical protein
VRAVVPLALLRRDLQTSLRGSAQDLTIAVEIEPDASALIRRPRSGSASDQPAVMELLAAQRGR